MEQERWREEPAWKLAISLAWDEETNENDHIQWVVVYLARWADTSCSWVVTGQGIEGTNGHTAKVFEALNCSFRNGFCWASSDLYPRFPKVNLNVAMMSSFLAVFLISMIYQWLPEQETSILRWDVSFLWWRWIVTLESRWLSSLTCLIRNLCAETSVKTTRFYFMYPRAMAFFRSRKNVSGELGICQAEVQACPHQRCRQRFWSHHLEVPSGPEFWSSKWSKEVLDGATPTRISCQ